MSDKEERIEYDYDVQKLLLQFLITDPNSYVRCQHIIKPEYWLAQLRPVCRFILNHTAEFNGLPSPEQIKAISDIDCCKIPDLTEQHTNWFLKTIEDFCKNKAMERLVEDGPKLLADGNYAEFERRSKENVLISLQTNLGTDYFKNPLDRLQNMVQNNATHTTGWKEIDKVLYGGMSRGELSFFAGGPGTGKSLFLQNIAINWVQSGLNVAYITLELSEDKVALRMDAMFTNRTTVNVVKDMEHTALTLGTMQQRASTKWGKLFIKKLPMAGTTSNDIRAYLKELEIQLNIKVDAIVVDYLDLLHPNSKMDLSNLFVKDKFITEELRALAGECNVFCCTASQLNRNSIQENDFDMSHIAGGISKINTADNVMAILTSLNLREKGEYQIQFLKTRSSNGVGNKIFLKFNTETMRITDLPNDQSETVRSQSSITDQIKQRLSSKQTENVQASMQESSSTDAADKLRKLISLNS